MLNKINNIGMEPGEQMIFFVDSNHVLEYKEYPIARVPNSQIACELVHYLNQKYDRGGVDYEYIYHPGSAAAIPVPRCPNSKRKKRKMIESDKAFVAHKDIDWIPVVMTTKVLDRVVMDPQLNRYREKYVRRYWSKESARHITYDLVYWYPVGKRGIPFACPIASHKHGSIEARIKCLFEREPEYAKRIFSLNKHNDNTFW